MAKASEVIALARSWVGKKEADGSFKVIIDTYNTQNPRPRGYKVQYTDEWCATFISALAVQLKCTNIMPTECSCQKMIELYKNIGCWVEDENRTPSVGDIIFYDWQDNGSGDNQGWSDHVGIVEKVDGKSITVIEGNLNCAVGKRVIGVNGRYIRGYAVPKYDAEPKAEPVKKVNSKVLEWQKAAIADGFKFPKYGADGVWGSECENVAKNAIAKKRIIHKYKNLTKIVQKAVGAEIDGKFGSKTKEAVIAYQKKHGLVADGAVGINTWKVILGV